MTTNSDLLAGTASVFSISLDDYSAISLSGEEQTSYLQGQVTCDVASLDEHKLLNGGHCNAKGKVFAIFRLFNFETKHFLLQPKASLTASLAELKKFGVFAKVEIEEATNVNFTAIVGEGAHDKLLATFGKVPDSLSPSVEIENATLIYLSGDIQKYILISKIDSTNNLLTKLDIESQPAKLWQAIEILEGFPTLGENAIDQYVPQMLNLQAINGISFTKGCYLGQETVARMQYLGKNKRALFYLTGKTTNPLTPKDSLELQLGENWRKAGDIIASYQADNGDVHIQAVLANDVDSNTKFRVKNDEQSSFSVSSLPYSITEE